MRTLPRRRNKQAWKEHLYGRCSLGKACVPGNRLRSNRWVGWVEIIAQGWAGEERTRTFGLIQAALACWEKRASRVIDCEAIGGSGGWKRMAQGWAGEERTRTFETNRAAH